MKQWMQHAVVRRVVLSVVTIGLVAAALAIGQGRPGVDLQVGATSPVAFVATRSVEVEDLAATALARQEARERVEDRYETDPDGTVAAAVVDQIVAVFDRLEEVVTETPPNPIVPTLPDEPSATTTTTSTTVAGDDAEPAAEVTEPTVGRVSGRVFLDADGNGEFDPGVDLTLAGLMVTVVGSDDRRSTVATDAAGLWVVGGVVVDGRVLVFVDPTDPALPEAIRLQSANSLQTLEGAEELEAAPVVFAPNWRDLQASIDALAAAHPQLETATQETLVDIAREDVLREASGRQPQIANVEAGAVGEASARVRSGIRDDELNLERSSVLQRPPIVTIDGRRHDGAERATADLVATFLRPSEFVDQATTELLRARAADAVEPVMVTFRAGETIVAAGEELTQVRIAAITMLNLDRPTSVGYGAVVALATVLVSMLFIYLARFRPGFWASEQRVVLLGVILVLTALVIRGVHSLASVNGEVSVVLSYALPVAGIGFLVSVVFDPRIAVLMSVAAATMTGVVFGDAGLVLYAAIATIAPVPLVSSISSSRDQRRAIFIVGLAAGVIAASVAWFFHSAEIGWEGVLQATAMAVAAGWVGSIVAIFLVSIFESIFDITTNLRLLELVDRNHEALQLLQEKAWGTFNHSLMVGTLADRAARSVGANPLLARAAAYYHDLGKTEAPIYFIENQFGVPNPHDRMEPKESAAVVRAHVTDGRRLARQYRLPSEVAEGILCHHGDGIMRFFYETAKERYGADNVDVEDYRHVGHKPKSREMAILMMADSLEGATRATFADHEPTPEAIASVVERVVAEKVNDGQLSESALTLGDLQTVKAAFLEALVGHYHQRIPYPNFPDAPENLGGPAVVEALPGSSVAGDVASPDEEVAGGNEQAERVGIPRRDRP